MRIAFLTNQLGLRGTETTLWGYAHFYEKMYPVECFILVRNLQQNNEGLEWFQKRFGDRVVIQPTEKIDAWLLNKHIAVCLVECGGFPTDYVPTSVPTIVHSVFHAGYKMGTVHTAISHYVALKGHSEVKVLPNILYLENHSHDLRGLLGIPKEARVFGRYGGFHQFDIPFVHEAIIETDPNIYFIFMNTEPFCSLPNVKFLKGTAELSLKRAFINTCDAMIHARSDGETFGCAIGEFALCGKPILTSIFQDNAHLELLGNSAYIYTSKESLKEWFVHLNLREEKRFWHLYGAFIPEKVIPILHQMVEEAERRWH